MMSWTQLFNSSVDDFHGVVSNFTAAEEIIRLYELCTVSTFRVFRRNKGFTEDVIRKQIYI